MKNKLGWILFALVLVVGYAYYSANFLTIVDFRKNFDPNDIVYQTTSHRCLTMYEDNPTIAVNSRLSVPPDSSLKSITFPVADKDEIVYDGAKCFYTYNLASSESVDVTDYSASALRPCAGYVNDYIVKCQLFLDGELFGRPTADCNQPDGSAPSYQEMVECSRTKIAQPYYDTGLNYRVDNCEIIERKLNNPDCPVDYFKWQGSKTIVKEGVVSYNEEINDFVCSDSNVVIPYKCYSDVCRGQDLKIDDAKVCVSVDSISAEKVYDKYFNGIPIEPVDGGSSDSASGESSEQQQSSIDSFITQLNDVIKSVVEWFKDLV